MSFLKEILIRKLTEENENEVLDLIGKYYAPVCYGDLFGLKGEDVVKYTQILAKMKLKQNSPLGAFVKETNQLVGVVFGGVIEKGSFERIDFIKEGLQMSLDLQAAHNFFMELESDIFDLLKTDRFFHSEMVCVHKDYRGKRIDSSLRKTLYDIALQSGCRYLVFTATNEIRIQVTKKLGCVVLKEVKYHDYHDPETKSTIFKNTKYPYVRAQVIYRKLQDSENKLKADI